MQRRLWTQMRTLFNKNMKYDLASRELKDSYKIMRCSRRLGHGCRTTLHPAQSVNFKLTPWKGCDKSSIILFLWPCGDRQKKICFLKQLELHLGIWKYVELILHVQYVLQKQNLYVSTNKPEINCSSCVKRIEYLIDGLGMCSGINQ